MKRFVCVLIPVLFVAAGAIVVAQTATGGDPGFLKRNFTPIAYLKASDPSPDAKLGFGSALTGRT